MARLEVISGAARQEVYLWEDQELVIGRSLSHSDLHIERPQVSRVHARIVFRDDRFHVIDQLSHYGTKVNGAQVQSYPLADGAVITLGYGVKLRFTDELEFMAPALPFVDCPPTLLPVGILDLAAARKRALLGLPAFSQPARKAS